MCPAVSDSIVALAGIIGPVCGDARDFLLGRDLVQQVGQDRRVADVAPSDIDGPNFQRFLVNPEVDLAPDTPFGTAMFTSVPLTFNLGRQLGPEGIDTFRETKMVMIDPECAPQDFWWFPYPNNEAFEKKAERGTNSRGIVQQNAGRHIVEEAND